MTIRDSTQKLPLEAQGIIPVLWPEEREILEGYFKAEQAHLLVSAAPDTQGDPLLQALPDVTILQSLVWIGYLSTTAVYGDHGGAWVDETTPVTPMSERGKYRAAAEQAWMNYGAEIFRLAGIYGVGRGPFEKIRQGKARLICKQGQVFGRIHVEDIAQVLQAAMAMPNAGEIYNLCDDLTCPPEEVLLYAAQLLQLPPPPKVDFETAQMSPMARSFYQECKRVRNDKIKEVLNVSLRYPTYKEGLRAILSQESIL